MGRIGNLYQPGKIQKFKGNNMVKRMGKAGFMGLMVIFLSVLTIGGLAGNAAAGTFTLGTITGTGTVTVDGNNNPTAYSFLGAFAFDNITPVYNTWTLASPQLMNDLRQYTFAASSSANVLALDWNSNPANLPIPRGSFNWVLNNTSGPDNATLYGNDHSFNFVFIPGTGTPDHGTLTGTVKSSDGNIHWYYGYDTDTFPPVNGMTPLAFFGGSDTFDVNGNFTVTGVTGSTINYSLIATVTGSPVPLPPSALFLGSGLLGLVGLRWRRRQAS